MFSQMTERGQTDRRTETINIFQLCWKVKKKTSFATNGLSTK